MAVVYRLSTQETGQSQVNSPLAILSFTSVMQPVASNIEVRMGNVYMYTMDRPFKPVLSILYCILVQPVGYIQQVKNYLLRYIQQQHHDY